MTVTQTYYLAHTARGKLSSEASRSDHDLRLLVGHANLLDTLMIELADAEQEQEAWFNSSVTKAAAPAPAPQSQRHIQWADTIVEEEDEEESSDSDSDFDDDEDMLDFAPLVRVPSYSAPASFVHIEQVDEEEDVESLSLSLSPSHASQ